jgi:hypothetical protein
MFALLADGNMFFVVGLAFGACNVAHFYTFMLNFKGRVVEKACSSCDY